MNNRQYCGRLRSITIDKLTKDCRDTWAECSKRLLNKRLYLMTNDCHLIVSCAVDLAVKTAATQISTLMY